jgi:hypothetical protein
MRISFDLNDSAGDPGSPDDLIQMNGGKGAEKIEDSMHVDSKGEAALLDMSSRGVFKIYKKAVFDKQVEGGDLNPLAGKSNLKLVELIEDAGKIQVRAFGEDTSIIEELLHNEAGEVEVVLYDIDDAGQEISYHLDPGRVTVSAMGDEEYQRFYDATYTSFQNLALQFQSVKEQQESGDDRKYPLAGRVQDTSGNGGENSDKSTSTDQTDRQRARVVREGVEKKAEKGADEAKAAHKVRYEKVLLELVTKFRNIHTDNRNKENAINNSIQNQRSVRVIQGSST